MKPWKNTILQLQKIIIHIIYYIYMSTIQKQQSTLSTDTPRQEQPTAEPNSKNNEAEQQQTPLIGDTSEKKKISKIIETP